ncbi:hypothetical protein COCON_G00147010 [Conger conger]|uniref:Arf-GAP with coiled-coil, ANK repeat and PH domain-containing protein n=1 Tax=Conger conger TaxID=82655 RepID=A0A9Q1DBW9_CONCO|nr:hypothetical protein COCON_G00147010 [Conger conger]
MKTGGIPSPNGLAAQTSPRPSLEPLCQSAVSGPIIAQAFGSRGSLSLTKRRAEGVVVYRVTAPSTVAVESDEGVGAWRQLLLTFSLSVAGTAVSRVEAPMKPRRANIDEVETEVVEIEAKLDKLVKLCSGMIEAGKAYISANKLFVSGVRDLSQQCKKDEMISECLEKCGESLQEIVNYHIILFDQAQRSVKQQLHNFVKEDVRKFKETKKQFDKVREDMEIAQVKNAQAPRNKPHEVEEATGTLSITRKCFRHLALDYVLQINVLQAKKKFEILDAMLSFMHAQYTLFQQGYTLLEEIDPYMKKLAAELDQLVIDSAMEKRDMEHKHATIQQREHVEPRDDTPLRTAPGQK